MIIAFPRHTWLPLDGFLYALQPSIPHLKRSSLHRCLQHGISRLPDVEDDKPKRQKFKRYPIGFFFMHCPAAHGCMQEKGILPESETKNASFSLCGNRPH